MDAKSDERGVGPARQKAFVNGTSITSFPSSAIQRNLVSSSPARTSTSSVSTYPLQAESSDDNEDDGGRFITDTASLREYITKQIHEYGRTFAANAKKYDFPMDEKESSRQDLVHHIFTLCLRGALYMSPMASDPGAILDIGTGTGIWAIDMADKFPNAHIIGTDLYPSQPSWVPPNLEFQIDDAEDDWTFPANSFDMVHFRYMRGVFDDWRSLMKKCYHVLKPGGHIEIQDIEVKVYCDDGSVPHDSVLHQFHEYLYQATEISGRRMKDQIPTFKPNLEAEGFLDIRHRECKVPVGTWAKDKRYKELGAYMQLNSLEGYEAVAMKLYCKWLGWTKEQVDEFGRKWKAEVKNTNSHAYYKFHFFSARKPHTHERFFASGF